MVSLSSLRDSRDALEGDVDHLFAPYADEPVIAVSCSGGGDSTALMLLLDHWRQRRFRHGDTAPELILLGVNHQLRPNSFFDFDHLLPLALDRGLPFYHLLWPPPLHPGNLQAAARHGRYRLMASWCARYGVPVLLTAHHQDDQAETVLMQVLRGSGPESLSGAAPRLMLIVDAGNIRLERPLLTIPRDRLRDFLQRLGVSWYEDHSNRDPRFTRARLRAFRETLPPPMARHLVRRLARTADLARNARNRRCHRICRVLNQSVSLQPTGTAKFMRAEWLRLHDDDSDTAYHLLSLLLHRLGGGSAAPRAAVTMRLIESLRTPTPPRSVTAAGCLIRFQDEIIHIGREPQRLEDKRVELRIGESVIWDRRFRLHLRSYIALRDSIFFVAAAPADLLPYTRSAFSPRLYAAPPALYYGDAVVALPHFDLFYPPLRKGDLDCECLISTILTHDIDLLHCLIL